MDEPEAEPVLAVLDPLLRAFEMLAFVARHLHPPDFAELMSSIGTPDEDLKSARANQRPERLSGIRGALDAASDAALAAFAGLRATLEGGGDIRGVYRALRLLPKGLEALYPLAGILSPVNRFFLDPSLRSDETLQKLFLPAPASDNTGVMQFAAGDSERADSGSTFPSTTRRIMPGRWSWRCMAAAAPGACFCGAGCAMPAAAAPSWWPRLRSAAPGL